MTLAWIISVTIFAIAMVGTPGPNNTMLTASGANYGYKRTIPHMLGITFGSVFITFIVGLFGASFISDPQVHDTLKWVGIIYLFWLSWKIASAKPKLKNQSGSVETGSKPFTFLQAALFQFLNPKVWVIVASATVTYLGPVDGKTPVSAVITLSTIFLLISFPCLSLWTMIGVGAGKFLTTERSIRIFNCVMATMLMLSLMPVIFE